MSSVRLQDKIKYEAIGVETKQDYLNQLKNFLTAVNLKNSL